MKFRAVVLLGLLVVGQVFAQEEAQPQIAFRIFSDYVGQQESRSGRKGWAYATIAGGGLLLAGSGVTWFLGDQIMANRPRWTPEVKTIATLSLAGAGLTAIATGLIGISVRPASLSSQYPLIFNETDPIVQEAMAVAAIRDLAKHGRSQRVTTAIMGIATPVLTLVVQTILNVSRGNPWYDNYGTAAAWQIPSMVSSFASLFRQSNEERLYEKYLSARSAIYGSP